MFIFNLVLFFFSGFLLCFVCGLGFSVFLCRDGFARYRLLLAPVLGMILLALASTWASGFGLSGVWANRFVLATVLAFSLWMLHKVCRRESLRTDFRHLIPLMLIALLTIAPSSILLARHQLFTSPLESYALYVTAPAEHLMAASIWQVPVVDHYKPISNLVSTLMANRKYLGFFFLLANIASITGMLPYQIYLVLSAIAGAFLPIAIYACAVEAFGMEKKWALLCALLAGLNTSLLIWTVIGQLPMVIGIVCLTLSVALLPRLFSDSVTVHDIILYGLFVAGLISFYPPLIPYVAGLFALCFAKKLIERFSPAVLVKRASKVLLIVALMNPFTIFFLVSHGLADAVTTSKFTHNVPRYPFLRELCGFTQVFTEPSGETFTIALGLCATLALLLALTGLMVELKSRRFYLATAALFFTAWGGFFSAIDFVYHFYKNSVVGLFVFLCCMVAGLRWLWRVQLLQLVARSFAGGFLAVFLILNAINFYRFAVENRPMVDKDFVELKSVVNSVPEEAILLVDVSSPTEEAWVSYFLKNVKTKIRGLMEPWGFWILDASGRSDDSFFYHPINDRIDFLVSRNSSLRKDIVSEHNASLVFKNQILSVRKGLPEPYLLTGWYPVEDVGGGPYRWTDRTFSMVFEADHADTILTIEGTVPDHYRRPVEAFVRLNGKEVGRFSAPPGRVELNIKVPARLIRATANLVEISLSETFIPKERGDSGDARRLGMMIRKASIRPNEVLAK